VHVAGLGEPAETGARRRVGRHHAVGTVEDEHRTDQIPKLSCSDTRSSSALPHGSIISRNRALSESRPRVSVEIAALIQDAGGLPDPKRIAALGSSTAAFRRRRASRIGLPMDTS